MTDTHSYASSLHQSNTLYKESTETLQTNNSNSNCGDDDDRSAFDSRETTMAIQWKNGKLGCVYYDHLFQTLYLMEDTPESTRFEFVRQLIDQIQPCILLLTHDTFGSFETLLELYECIRVEKRSFKEFDSRKGRISLLNWYIHQSTSQDFHSRSQAAEDYSNNNNNDDDDDDDSKRTQAMIRLTGLINPQSHITIGCAGALLSYLQQIEDCAYSTTSSGSRLYPLSLKTFTNKLCVQINAETSKSLSLFEKDTHPNMHQKRGKEGFSLFGVLDQTVTPLGHHLLRQWLQRPSLDISLINTRHLSVEYFSGHGRAEMVKELVGYLGNIKNVARLLANIREHRATHNEWNQLLNFAYYGIRINGLFKHSPQLPIISKIQAIDKHLLRTLGTDINDTIDFGQSSTENRVVVNTRINKDLDLLKKKYEALDDYLLSITQDMSADMPIGIGAMLNVVYFPQLGFLVTLPYTITSYPKDFELQFTTGENLYFKNPKTKELDQDIGDVHAMMIDKEVEIIQALSERTIEAKQMLLETAEILAELDCLVSLGLVARQNNYVKPEMTNEDKLCIIQGRHPIQELWVDRFIPNDTRLRQASFSAEQQSTIDQDGVGPGKVMVLSGANYSGKSVYLKQVALITFMAHIGSFVPASHATIGLTDRIFTRIQTSETISQVQSAFSYDLQQLLQAITYSTSHSLVIIDEFGKGTSSSDGIGLFCAVLEEFLSKKARCPKVIASTHFHEIISRQLLRPDGSIGFYTTQIIINQQTNGSESEPCETDRVKDIVFLYQIVPGVGLSGSYGAWCASLAGIPPKTVNRGVALYLSDRFGSQQPIEPLESEREFGIFKQLEDYSEEFLMIPVRKDSQGLTQHRDLIKSISDLFSINQE
ncbi:muts domain V-domain-containing protein [Phycomyces blakesleeanus]|uniref:Muts domain V-domain-containing protein n=1 Tax=Phycomyces blakesleeanus TaxID=4837 RepID=A0ABR3BDJ2_PHYBL